VKAPSEPEPCDPVGARDIAERLEVQQNTVAMWRKRGLLPPHRWTVSGFPAWNWPDIEKWDRETRRRGAGRPAKA